MAKPKAPFSMSDVFQDFQAAQMRADETREKRDKKLAVIRERLLAGETTGDACQDFVLLHFGIDNPLVDALFALHKRLESHAHQLILFVQYTARRQANDTVEATWRLGLLDGAGILFPKSETGLPSLQIGTRTVYRQPELLFGDRTPFLDALRAGTLETSRDSKSLTASCHLFVGNAAVIEWFTNADKTTVPYSLWINCTWVTLATALLEMGVSPGNLPEMHAWLEEKKSEFLKKLASATESWEGCLKKTLHSSIRDDEPPSSSADVGESRVPISSRVIGGSRYVEPNPTAQDLLKQFREANQKLGRLVLIGDELKLEGDPLFDKAHALWKRCF